MIVLPSASSAFIATPTLEGVPLVTLDGLSTTESDATTPLKVTLTLLTTPDAIVCVRVPVESRLPLPRAPSYSETTNVSGPGGTSALPVQLADVHGKTVAENPPLTVTLADRVAVEMYSGRFAFDA
jgi:hypothetical protein